MSNFNELISDILEVDSFNSTDTLKSFAAWDSLAILSTIAMANANFGKKLSVNDINAVTTIEELQKLIEG